MIILIVQPMSKFTDPKRRMMGATKNTVQLNKLSEDMENQIKDAFAFYDVEKTGTIPRNNLRSILGNFAFSKMNGKEIEETITENHGSKEKFTLSETIQMITKQWFDGKGRQAEAEEMFTLFDRKERGLVGLAEIKHVFNQYLDINITDSDIMEFIEEADADKDGFLSKEEFFSKLGYM